MAEAQAGSFGGLSLSLNPELLEFLMELASEDSEKREAIELIIDEYIDEWLLQLRPLPYIPNLVVEAARKRRWITEVVDRLGAETLIDAMRVALEARYAPPEKCHEVAEVARNVAQLLIDAMEVEPGPVIESILESGDCEQYAALIASLIAVKPMKGGE